MGSILITAGENSGDKYGADLVHRFKTAHPGFDFFGVGGSHMDAQGVDRLYTVEDLAVVGVFEVVSHLPRLKKMFSRILARADEAKPDAAVLIDSPDFNLRLAGALHKRGIPVLYYISPTVWAWRRRRLKTIKKHVDRMLLIFPFEAEIYESQNISSAFIGHPLKERVRTSMSRSDFFQKHDLDPERPLIAILPGSRKSEIHYHLPVLNRALPEILSTRFVQIAFILSENLNPAYLERLLSRDLTDAAHRLSEDRYEAMAFSDLVLASCGTANLEAALLSTPHIAFYRISPLTYALGHHLIKIKEYSIVNILAGRRVIPELIQGGFTPDRLCREVSTILDKPEVRRDMILEFRKIAAMLGDQPASANAAEELWRLLSYGNSRGRPLNELNTG